jgi:hypothetical protein
MVSGTTLPGFAARILTYTVELPSGTADIPAVNALTTDPAATVSISPAISIPGSTAINVTAEDGTTQLHYLITFRFSGLGIDQFQDLSYLQVYPNPSGGRFELNYNNKQALGDRIEIKVLDVSGRVVYRLNKDRDNHNATIVIDLSHHPRGIYLIDLRCGSDEKVQKVIVN